MRIKFDEKIYKSLIKNAGCQIVDEYGSIILRTKYHKNEEKLMELVVCGIALFYDRPWSYDKPYDLNPAGVSFDIIKSIIKLEALNGIIVEPV